MGQLPNVVSKARTACEAAGRVIGDHFVEATKMVDLGSGSQREVDDLMLTRYACCLHAAQIGRFLNADAWLGAESTHTGREGLNELPNPDQGVVDWEVWRWRKRIEQDRTSRIATHLHFSIGERDSTPHPNHFYAVLQHDLPITNVFEIRATNGLSRSKIDIGERVNRSRNAEGVMLVAVRQELKQPKEVRGRFVVLERLELCDQRPLFRARDAPDLVHPGASVPLGGLVLDLVDENWKFDSRKGASLTIQR